MPGVKLPSDGFSLKYLTVLVSVASRREDRTGNLGAPPRGQAQAFARRILDYRQGIVRDYPGLWGAATGARQRRSWGDFA